jgi:hypothetical protein
MSNTSQADLWQHSTDASVPSVAEDVPANFKTTSTILPSVVDYRMDSLPKGYLFFLGQNGEHDGEHMVNILSKTSPVDLTSKTKTPLTQRG